MDANITTLITALVLYEYGTGPIKGFAVTLSIGVVTSVVGAFYYLRIVKIMFFDDAAEAFQPREGKLSAVMVLSAGFVVLFVLPFIGGTLVDAATAAAAVLVPAQAL